MSYNKKYFQWLIIITILVIGLFFRFYQLDATPPGLWPDEATNGIDALKSLDSNDFKIFYPDNNGREGLFIKLQAISIKLFGPTPYALRVVSAFLGTLTILGLYLLVRHLFNWHLAAISSFFLAISFWHVNFSRIGFRAILLPLVMVFGFYFLWRGIRNNSLKDFLFAGIIGGLGFYTYFSFRIVPLIVLILFWNYWSYLKKDFSNERYEISKNQLLRGFTVLMLATIIVALPLGAYFYDHPEDFLKREGRPISIFEQDQPLKELGKSIVGTLAMFTYSGDQNQRHNIPGSPMLVLPMAIFFVIGFIREFIHWLRRKHGHYSPIHTFLFSWFFIMLLPGFLSTEAPHALRTIGVIPVVMIFTAQGFHWLISSVIRWHRMTDPHFQFDKPTYKKESKILIATTILSILISLGIWEYARYFRAWAHNENTQKAFSQNYIDISNYINSVDIKQPLYVLVNEGDVLIDGVPNNAQTIKFLTLTYTSDLSMAKNIYYITEEDLISKSLPFQFTLIPLKDSLELTNKLSRFGLRTQQEDSLIIYKK